MVHTVAYWLMLMLRGLTPKLSFWRDALFDTIRISLLKVAARVTQMATRIRIGCQPARLIRTVGCCCRARRQT